MYAVRCTLLLLPAAGCPYLLCAPAAALTGPTCRPPPNAAAHHYFPVQVVYEDRQALENTDHPYVLGGWRGRRSCCDWLAQGMLQVAVGGGTALGGRKSTSSKDQCP